MRVIGKDRSGCDACNPLDEIIARIEQLERRVVTIVARVQGIPPDGTGNVTLPTSDSVDGPLYGNIGAFAMSSEVKEAAEDVHQYASAIADDVVVLQSDVEILIREVEALDPASVTALQQSVTALQQSVTQLSNTVAGYSAIIGDLEDQMPNKVNRTGDTMTGPLNVIDTATGSRNAQAVNGNRLQNDLDNYAPMVRNTGNRNIYGNSTWKGKAYYEQTSTSTSVWMKNMNYNIGEGFVYVNLIGAQDKSANSMGYIQWLTEPSGIGILRIHVRNSDGTFKTVDIAKGDVIQ